MVLAVNNSTTDNSKSSMSCDTVVSLSKTTSMTAWQLYSSLFVQDYQYDSMTTIHFNQK